MIDEYIIIYADLNEKTKVMVSIIDDNEGDSFAGRAETFYRRRRELVSTIQDVHKSYGCLAEKYKRLAKASRIEEEEKTRNVIEAAMDDEVRSKLRLNIYGCLAEKYKQLTKASRIEEVEAEEEETEDVIEAMDDEVRSKLRLRVMRLIEDNLYQQSEMMTKNNENREAIRDFRSRIESLVDEQRDIKACFARHVVTDTKRLNGIYDAT